MVQFLGDAVFLLELSLFTLGLATFHFGQQQHAKVLQIAGVVLSGGSAATAVCTTYFWIQYAQKGDFDRALLAITNG